MLTNLAEAATKALDALNQHTISREKAMMAAFINAGAQCARRARELRTTAALRS